MHSKLAELHQYLERLDDRADLEKLSELLRALDISADELAGNCSFSESTYKRNTLASSEWYDLVLMCWRSGQATKIHDHAESSCAFKILKGTASETRFNRVPGARGYQGYVTAVGEPRFYKSGQICSAQDSEIHRISNDRLGEDLVTLHIYSPPLNMSFYEVDGATPDMGIEPFGVGAGDSLKRSTFDWGIDEKGKP